MYSQLAVIALIDVEAALATGSLLENSYLIDNNRFMGSTGQGTGNLTTMVVGTQVVNWLVSGIDLSGKQPTPALIGIGGEAVEKQIMVPQLFDSPALDGNMGYWWGATVDSNTPGIYTYTITLDIGGKTMQLKPSVNIQTGFTMEPLAFVNGRKSATSLKERAISDGTLKNPDNHVSIFPKISIDKLSGNKNK